MINRQTATSHKAMAKNGENRKKTKQRNEWMRQGDARVNRAHTKGNKIS